MDIRFASLTGILILVLGLGGLACDGDRPADEIDTSARSGEPNRPGLEPSERENRSDEYTLPARGRVHVLPSAQRVTVLANEAQRRLVLKTLESERRFRTTLAEGVAIRGTITLHLVDVSVDEVLARVLEGHAYAVYYDVDEETGAAILARVSVGQDRGPTRVETAPAEPAAENLAALRARSERRRDAARQRAAEEEDWVKEERLAARQQAFREELASTDSGTRADAASFIRADRQTIPTLSSLVTADPDPAVRAAAAETLGEAGDSPEAVSALLLALEDPNPEVVIAALDALEWTGETSVIPEIEFLLEHPNAEVRERTGWTLDWLAP